MGALTEVEIFDQMATQFRVAGEACDRLAARPSGGVTYDRLRKALRLLQGCCRQASVWREDARWLPIAQKLNECHHRAGDWLRGIKQQDGRRLKLAPGTLHPAFLMLAALLRQLAQVADTIRHQRTGRVGMILPRELPGPHRDTRPVGWRDITPCGILLPHGASFH